MDTVNYHSTANKKISLIEADYQDFSFTRHYHLDFHIGLIISGQQKFHYQGTHHQVGSGQLVIMPPDEIHDGQSMLKSGYQTRVFSLEPEWLTNLAQLKKPSELIHFKQIIVAQKDIFQSLVFLHQTLKSNNVCQLAQDCLPYEGFEKLFSHYSSIEQKPAVALGNQSIATLKEYLIANIDQPVRLEQLSELCQLSPTQFQRHFKAKMGLTPYAWLCRLRMEQSMKLLKMGIGGTEVAYKVGFYDQAHFSKAFKVTYGVNPSQIR